MLVACLVEGLLLSLASAAEPVAEAELGEGVGLTVYNQGFAIVKERRKMELPRGRSVVKFGNVADTIVPETVQFESLRPAGGARVVEQNYEFDLVSADKLLDKYIDKKIGLVTRDGSLIEGRLLAFDWGELILATDDGVEMVPRGEGPGGENIKDIRFASLPEGLLTKPTLVWQVEAAQAGNHLVKVAYRADEIAWRVDYRVRCDADGATLGLAGWATITNDSGATFKDARVKLMAGHLHLVKEPGLFGSGAFGGGGGFAKSEPAFEEKACAEYHLYTLGRRATIKDRQTKQIELIDIEGIPVKRKYVYRPEWGKKVGVVLAFKNDEKVRKGLGIPLPKGPIRVYQVDTDGQVEFIGQDGIDHTPEKEEVKVRIGYAFDIVVERTQTQEEKLGVRSNEEDWRVRVRNHKDVPITVELIEPLDGSVNWRIVRKSREYREKDYRTIAFDVDVPANAERVVTYAVRYQL